MHVISFVLSLKHVRGGETHFPPFNKNIGSSHTGSSGHNCSNILIKTSSCKFKGQFTCANFPSVSQDIVNILVKFHSPCTKVSHVFEIFQIFSRYFSFYGSRVMKFEYCLWSVFIATLIFNEICYGVIKVVLKYC